ncbi:MAG: PEGA domain-containing protein [Candidatus Omnitrophica bacterium]|nr:PEGA domain-containing protein [Candidatus Omnitrophota bacterium]
MSLDQVRVRLGGLWGLWHNRSMVIFRKILFYLFLALYLVLCPIIILYAFGYIFTPKGEEGFAKTGLIHIETLPANAFLSIAGKRYAEKTPATIRNLLPGTYDMKILLRGHRPWERKVEVEPGKAVNFEKVLLVPQNLKIRTLVAKPFEDLWPVAGTRYLLLKRTERAGDLWVFDWKNEVSRQVLPEDASFAAMKLMRVFRVKDSPFVILQVKASDGMRFLGCQLDKESLAVTDLSRLFMKGEPDEISWEGGRPDYLFALYGQDLLRLDLEKMTVLPDFLSKIRGFGLFKNKVYALRGSSIFRLGFGSKPGEEALVEKGVFLENLFSGEEKYKIDFISNNAICFLGERGELFSNALPYRFVDEGVRGYQTDSDGRKVALWQEGRVGVLDFEKPERKKEFFERGPEIEWIFEKGKNIRQAYFVCDASYILFCDDGEISLARLGERESFPEKLVRVREGSGFFYAEKTGKLYFLESSRGELVAADILPEGVTFSGVFGELEKETQEAMK